MGGQESESRVIAANLVREGIEVVRSIRDSNWLACTSWTNQQCDTWDYSDDGDLNNDLEDRLNKDYSAIAVFDTDNNLWHLDFTPNMIKHDIATKMYLYKTEGYWLMSWDFFMLQSINGYFWA